MPRHVFRTQARPSPMRKFVVILLVVLVIAGGGLAFLATWDIPPPSAKVEKVIPNDRLGK